MSKPAVAMAVEAKTRRVAEHASTHAAAQSMFSTLKTLLTGSTKKSEDWLLQSWTDLVRYTESLSGEHKVKKSKQCQEVLDRHPFLQSQVTAGTALPVPFAETSSTTVRKRKSAELLKLTKRLKAEAAAEEEAARADQESLLAELVQNPEAAQDLSFSELYAMIGLAGLQVSKLLDSEHSSSPETKEKVKLLRNCIKIWSKECIYEEEEEAEKEKEEAEKKALWPALEPEPSA